MLTQYDDDDDFCSIIMLITVKFMLDLLSSILKNAVLVKIIMGIKVSLNL